MNVKIIWPDEIESIDTRADGSAALAKAALSMEPPKGWAVDEDNDVPIVVWSQLVYDDGQAAEQGKRRKLFSASMKERPQSIIDALRAATIAAKKENGDVSRILRLDVDGETIIEATADDE